MPRGRKRFQQKHPEMRHEIARDAVIRVVEQNSHAAFFPACFSSACLLTCAERMARGRGVYGHKLPNCVGMQRARCDEVYDVTVRVIGCNTALGSLARK